MYRGTRRGSFDEKKVLSDEENALFDEENVLFDEENDVRGGSCKKARIAAALMTRTCCCFSR